MNKNIKNLLIALGLCCSSPCVFSQETFTLKNQSLHLEWTNTSEGYRFDKVTLNPGTNKIAIGQPVGQYTVLYSAAAPSNQPDWKSFDAAVKAFPDSSYILLHNRWNKQNLTPVSMNTAGEALEFYPSRAVREGNGIKFSHQVPQASVAAKWELDKKYTNDVLVELEITALQDGYFSIASPTFATLNERDLDWGIVPGHFQGKEIEKNLVLSYGYGQGIPNRPLLARDRTATTLSPLLRSKSGVTIAVIPEPGTARDPWLKDQSTQNEWLIGLSLMNRQAQLSPTLYHPVLGEKGSYLKAGEKKTFRFRYTVKQADWYEVYQHAVYDIYQFSDFLSKKNTKQSLSSRLWGMFDYVRKDQTSLWHTYDFKGRMIGAQEYNAPVVGSDKDAVKNSDYGAMWMMAKLTGDSVLMKTRLPYARNFKMSQQEDEDNFFKGAPSGQYYLWKSKRFTEEWGNYVEPIGLTYYTMLDIGNVLLFEPKDSELKERLRQGAERLMTWQKRDGSWEVAYDHKTHRPVFNDIKDLRPTFYGLIVAYRLLGEEKYLTAARKGADWFVENAVKKGAFLGVCGDFRFVPDFATGQSVQALLDLYDLTGQENYKAAALTAAKIYTTSIYTHPIPSDRNIMVKGKAMKEWEISQVGLSFEHGGTLGSAAKGTGPILLASHAGMFVRLYRMTGDRLFLEMARAGVWGRDAFVNKNNSVASYYWDGLDNGPGKFPHHAWWQVGWITDYLLSEVEMRSKGMITFPGGFITPKVGPHKTYGFEAGKLFEKSVLLTMRSGLSVDNPRVDYVMAIEESTGTVYVILLNNSESPEKAGVSVSIEQFLGGRKLNSVSILDEKGMQLGTKNSGRDIAVTLPRVGLRILQFKVK